MEVVHQASHQLQHVTTLYKAPASLYYLHDSFDEPCQFCPQKLADQALKFKDELDVLRETADKVGKLVVRPARSNRCPIPG